MLFSLFLFPPFSERQREGGTENRESRRRRRGQDQQQRGEIYRWRERARLYVAQQDLNLGRNSPAPLLQIESTLSPSLSNLSLQLQYSTTAINPFIVLSFGVRTHIRQMQLRYAIRRSLSLVYRDTTRAIASFIPPLNWRAQMSVR